MTTDPLDLPVTAINVDIHFSGDGLNDDSSLLVRVEGPNGGAKIGELWLQREMGDHAVVRFPLKLSSHPLLRDLDHSQLYLQIDTAHHGTDECFGRAVVFLGVEGDLFRRVIAGRGFRIGTSGGRSNSTRLLIDFNRVPQPDDPTN